MKFLQAVPTSSAISWNNLPSRFKRHEKNKKVSNDDRINQELRWFNNQKCLIRHHVLCSVAKRKTSVRKQSLRCHFPRRQWKEETPTARTESHKNLLTSLKILQLSFYFPFFFFIIFYGDPWWLEKQHSLYILSRFLNFLVENVSRLRRLSAYQIRICVWIWLE